MEYHCYIKYNLNGDFMNWCNCQIKNTPTVIISFGERYCYASAGEKENLKRRVKIDGQWTIGKLQVWKRNLL